MAKELNEDSGFTVSIKTLGGIGVAIATVVSMWFALQADIAEAKELPVAPPPEISRMEFDMKDQLVRQTIMTTQEDVTEIKATLVKLNDKIDALKQEFENLEYKYMFDPKRFNKSNTSNNLQYFVISFWVC